MGKTTVLCVRHRFMKTTALRKRHNTVNKRTVINDRTLEKAKTTIKFQNDI